jgi:chemotaxis protein CheD
MIATKNQIRIDEYTITVGLGEMAITRDPLISLACFGLGSCICLCAYDPPTKISGMVHIVLPKSKSFSTDKNATKYADVAVPVLLDEMIKAGAVKSRLVVKLAGGAQMIKSPDYNDAFEMGVRNLAMVQNLLSEQRIRISGSDTGGNQGRSVWMFVESGKVLVRKAGFEPEEM